ncbi:MAG TPA: diacylglycerol kinase family protein [Chloroflexota bacterium]
MTTRRPLFVFNPAAGGGRHTARLLPMVRAAVAAHGGAVVCTERPGHAVELARGAAAQRFDAVVGVGGDGTLHELANGLLDCGVGTPPALGAVPAGTGNDFVRSLGLPTDPSAAIDLVWAGATQIIDLARCGERFFLNAGGVGFDSRVARDAQRIPKSLRIGTLPYVAGVLWEVIRNTSNEVVLELDEQRIQRRSLMVAIANGAFYAGGMMICPHAKRDDGLLDVCVVGEMPRRDVLRLLLSVFSGGHVGHPLVEFHRTRRLRIECAAGSEIQLDGELVGSLPAVFEVAPNALRAIVPRTIG